MNKTITVSEAAVALGVTAARVRALVAAGRLKARRAGPRCLLIDEADLAAVRVRKPGRPRRTLLIGTKKIKTKTKN